MIERQALEELASSLYNKPAVPHFSSPTTGTGYGPGTRFWRWWELNEEQQEKALTMLSERLEEIGVGLFKKEPCEKAS